MVRLKYSHTFIGSRPATSDMTNIDEAVLSQKYDLVKFNVIGSTQISNRTAAIISRLEANENGAKPTLVSLSSKARTGNKLISIVEIAKRQLAVKGHKCFQYNVLSSEMIEMERKPKGVTNGAMTSVANEGDSEPEDAFEAMSTPRAADTKKRLIPVMTTYLCATSVKELKSAYGEQT